MAFSPTRRLVKFAKRIGLDRAYDATLFPVVNWLFATQLLAKTNNFSSTTWLGAPIWQNIFDLWVIQETIAQVRPALLIETGTNRGGSSLFYAHLFDLMGHGEVVTIDVERLHTLSHPRIEYLIGSSTSDTVLNRVNERVAATTGPVLVILDSDHSAPHVRDELRAYARLVTPGSFLLVQDGIIDVHAGFRHGRPGPLVALKEFVAANPEFEVDFAKSEKFLITHHPQGWLRRR